MACSLRYTGISLRGEIAMIRRATIVLLGAAAFALIGARMVSAQPVIPGSTAFCLFEVPIDETGKRRWINLGIVQYVEATQTEVRIFYGAGSLGSGHEARVAVTSMDAALLVLEKMRRVATACR